MLKDYTGYSARMQARVHPSSDEILFEIYPTVGDDGKIITVEIPNSITADIEASDAVYDIEMVSPEGKVSFPIFGRIAIRKIITR
jgi:hypothetical protein